MCLPQFEAMPLMKKLQSPYINHYFLLSNIFKHSQNSVAMFCVFPKHLVYLVNHFYDYFFNVSFSHSSSIEIHEDSVHMCLHYHILNI